MSDREVISGGWAPASEYRAIGEAASLKGDRLDLFAAYMMARWPNGVMGYYAVQWATRFADGREYGASDSEGRRILDRLSKEARA